MYYIECPRCGANLDPGEECDCEEEPPGMYEISDANIDRFYGESERPVRWLTSKNYDEEEYEDYEEELDDE